MKLAVFLTLIPLIFLAAAPEAEADAWTINGRVLSVLSDGLLISCVDDGMSAGKKPQAGETVFVKGRLSYAANDVVNLVAAPIGTHQFESPGKPATTVRAFEVRN